MKYQLRLIAVQAMRMPYQNQKVLVKSDLEPLFFGRAPTRVSIVEILLSSAGSETCCRYINYRRAVIKQLLSLIYNIFNKQLVRLH